MLLLAFTLGLMSSFHCVGMCGPIALALPVHHGSRWRQVTGLLTYNLGRVGTYTLLGAGIGALGGAVLWMGYLRYLSIVAGAAMLMYVFWPTHLDRILKTPLFWQKAIGQLKSRMAAQLRSQKLHSWAALGMLNGLLPCGLVYLALISSVATGSAISGGVYMLAFGLGTLPAMMAVGFFKQWFSPSLRGQMRRLTPVFVAVAGIWLLGRGLWIRVPAGLPASGETTELPVCHGGTVLK
ncbi:sulfite exporter TauE/SafE family protein [Persicitalea jodogahamensis]|uniref:Membrane protein n=1 Tax=Persicitalea jodogahamensis TaxID=402147 RepID=A0A8J3D7B8_9BACT|nr:sulfite exporter TauE/SafE family protein [Persicitalea jodogahamensis]GHB71607.1 membrane protein [Persicitalea jodogahamensis]